MIKGNTLCKKLLALLCVLLMLVYATVAFVPHAHECQSADCEICIIIDLFDEILIGVTLAPWIYWLKILLSTIRTHTYIPSGREATLVGRKVKLSD